MCAPPTPEGVLLNYAYVSDERLRDGEECYHGSRYKELGAQEQRTSKVMVSEWFEATCSAQRAKPFRSFFCRQFSPRNAKVERMTNGGWVRSAQVDSLHATLTKTVTVRVRAQR